MGQAKSRGSRDQRIAEALEEQNRKIEEVRKGLSLPDDTKFCGFLVHIYESDEFLHEIDASVAMTKRTFVKIPELAHRFENFNDAHKCVRPAKGETVVGLFDLGEKYLVAQLMDDPSSAGDTLH